jgi:lipoprotein-anchoring transpeptidase ErfK/SrfK
MSFSNDFLPVGKSQSRMLAAICAAGLSLASLPASASVVVHVSNATQRMQVSVDGRPTYSWPVSTARRGYRTPAGNYRVQHMARMHYSRLYHMSPMPYSMFFRGGYAIHGTYATGALGRPASHGCIRLAPGNARALYALVQRHGGAAVIVR